MARINHEYVIDRFVTHHCTIPEIAAELGCTGQAIHRILKLHNIGKEAGGKSAQMRARAAVAMDASDGIMCNKYGCTREQWDELRSMHAEYKHTPLAVYHTFKNNYLNINNDDSFQLSLWEWWTIWLKSGKWGQHKRNPDGLYVMSKIDRSKTLNKDNVHIIPFAELLQQRKRKPPKNATPDSEQTKSQQSVPTKHIVGLHP